MYKRFVVRGLLLPALGAVLLTAALAGPAWAEANRAPGYRTRHVIVAVMDGVRYCETFGDPEHRYVPRMWKELVPQGALYTNFYNRGVTVTRQGHSTIASGTYQVVPNGGPRLTRPTFFDYFREETGAPADQTWVIFGKGSYSFAPWSSFPVYLDRWAARAELGIGEKSLDDDRKVLERALSVMKEYRPALMFLNFGYTDHSGHVGTFAEYTKAVANVDALFADLWAAIQADPEYRDSTTLILTNDHGRHDDAHGGYHGHGDGCEGCRHIFLLILGPDTKQGVMIDEPAEQIDLAPTVGELLGFQTPLAEGRVLKESFRTYLGLNRKAARTATEQEAVRTLRLSERDLGRAVARYAQTSLNLANLPATPGTALLFDGLLTQAKASRSPDGVLVTRAARDWLEKTADVQGQGRLYRAYVLLDLMRHAGIDVSRRHTRFFRQEPQDLKDYLRLEQSLPGGGNPVDQAFLIDLLARAGAVKRLPALVDSLASLRADPSPAAGSPHEQALVLYALADAVLALEGQPHKEPGLAGFLTRLREVSLLRYYRAVQEQREPGGLWDDPVDSLLYLAAADRLQAAGLFRDFKPAKKPVKEKALRRRMASVIGEAQRYLAFSREQARYLVDEQGRVQGDDPVLAAGGFLSALAPPQTAAGPAPRP